MEMLRGAVGDFHDVSLDSSKEKKNCRPGIGRFFFLRRRNIRENL